MRPSSRSCWQPWLLDSLWVVEGPISGQSAACDWKRANYLFLLALQTYCSTTPRIAASRSTCPTLLLMQCSSVLGNSSLDRVNCPLSVQTTPLGAFVQ